MSDETAINHDPHDSRLHESRRNESHFSEPIPADAARRQLDRKILESYDSTQDRIRAISSRVTRMEAYFETMSKDLRKLEELQKEMAGHLETIAANSSASTNKLAIHTQMEEYQWTVVNKANETLEKIGAALNEHLQQSHGLVARIDWLERLMWALWGVMGAGALGLIPLALKGLGLV